MKRLLRLFLFCFYTLSLALSSFFTTAFPLAQAASDQTHPPSVGGYACILYDETYFYTTPNDRQGVFLLPKTYYVKILDYQTDFCFIEYLYDDSYTKKLIGYAKTELLTFVDYIPKRPYLYHVFDVCYTIEDSPLEDSAFLDEITVTCAYYGDYPIGTKTYCYILRDGVFGYIPKPATLSYVENHEYADFIAQSQQQASSSSTEKQTSSPAQFAILIALCLLVPVLAAFILKPPNRPPYEQENDFPE